MAKTVDRRLYENYLQKAEEMLDVAKYAIGASESDAAVDLMTKSRRPTRSGGPRESCRRSGKSFSRVGSPQKVLQALLAPQASFAVKGLTN